MTAILDAGMMLIPSGSIATSQDFPALSCAPRSLPTCAWVISMTTPPVAAATFTLAVASTANGVYSEIRRLVWPAGLSGSKSLAVGAGGNMAQVLNATAAWLRCSVVTTGPMTVAGSWLTKASDGGPGLGSRSYGQDGVNVL